MTEPACVTCRYRSRWGACRRFPTHVLVSEDHTCGEHAFAPSAAKVKGLTGLPKVKELTGLPEGWVWHDGNLHTEARCDDPFLLRVTVHGKPGHEIISMSGHVRFDVVEIAVRTHRTKHGGATS